MAAEGRRRAQSCSHDRPGAARDHLHGTGWVPRNRACLCGGTGEAQGPGGARSACRRRVTRPGPRTAGPGLSPIPWISSPRLPTGLGGAPAALWELSRVSGRFSLSLTPPLSPAEKLKTKPGSRRPLPTRGLKERARKTESCGSPSEPRPRRGPGAAASRRGARLRAAAWTEGRRAVPARGRARRTSIAPRPPRRPEGQGEGDAGGARSSSGRHGPPVRPGPRRGLGAAVPGKLSGAVPGALPPGGGDQDGRCAPKPPRRPRAHARLARRSGARACSS